ncbi:hypothetical protein pb186bvf_012609 [Paramecium bursaria]
MQVGIQSMLNPIPLLTLQWIIQQYQSDAKFQNLIQKQHRVLKCVMCSCLLKCPSKMYLLSSRHLLIIYNHKTNNNKYIIYIIFYQDNFKQSSFNRQFIIKNDKINDALRLFIKTTNTLKAKQQYNKIKMSMRFLHKQLQLANLMKIQASQQWIDVIKPTKPLLLTEEEDYQPIVQTITVLYQKPHARRMK